MIESAGDSHPHAGEPIVSGGVSLARADAVIVALHGRGASAADILGLAAAVAPSGVALLAPQAAGNSWYPYRFLEPIERNEPYLSSALRVVDELVTELDGSGVSADRIALLGFSQGACLALEFAARHPRRYGAVVAFSGGLIGPPGSRFDFAGSLHGTPILLGCSDIDSHIPQERVEESATALRRIGAVVDLRIYPGMGHTVNDDEIVAARSLLLRSHTGSSSAISD